MANQTKGVLDHQVEFRNLARSMEKIEKDKRLSEVNREV